MKDQETSWLQVFSALFLIILLTLIAFQTEYFQGRDREFYTRIFSSINFTLDANLFLNFRYEPGFILLVDAFKLFIVDHEYIFLLICLASLFLKFFACIKSSVNPFFFFVSYFFVLFFTLEINQIRLGISLSIILFSVCFFPRNMQWRYTFYLIACLFQYSTILIVVSLFVIEKRPNKKILLSIFSCLCLFIFTWGEVFYNQTRFSHYIASQYVRLESDYHFINVQSIWLFFVGSLLFLYQLGPISRTMPTGIRALFVLPAIGVIFYIFQSLGFPFLALRIFETFCFAIPFCLAWIFSYTKSELWKILLVILTFGNAFYLIAMIPHRIVS